MEEHLTHLHRVLQRLVGVGLKLKHVSLYGRRWSFWGTLLPRISSLQLSPAQQCQADKMLLLPSIHSIHSQTPSSVGTPFPWTGERQIAFTTLKCEAPVLAYLSFDKDFALETDASMDGIGAVLSQQQEAGPLRPH